MTLRAKLVTSFLGFAVLSMLLGAVNLLSTQRTIEQFEIIGHVNAPALLALGQIKAATGTMAESVQAFALVATVGTEALNEAELADQLADEQAELEDAKALVDEWVAEYRTAVQGQEGLLDRSTEISSAAARLYQQARVLVDLQRRGPSPANVLAVRENLEEEEEGFFYALDEVTNAHLQALDRQDTLAEQAARDAVTISIGVIAGLVVFAVGAGLLLTRLIAAPIVRLKEAAQDIGAGKLDTRINVDSGDEIGVLAGAFNQMVANLSATQLRLANIIGSMAEMLIVTDTQGVIQSINPAALDTLGYRSEELIGQTINVLLPKEDSALSRLNAIQLTGKSVNRDVETTFVSKDGNKIPIAFSSSAIQDQQGVSEGIVCVARDISERVQSEQTLREQDAFLRQVIDLNPGFVFVKDWEGKYLLANQPTAQLYGTTVDELVGKSDADFNPNSDELEIFLSTDQAVMRSGQPMFIAEEQVTYVATGETRWFQMTKVPLMAERLEDRRVLGISTDITARKQAEVAVREQETFLRQVIDLIPGSIFVKDWNGRFVLGNKTVADLYGAELSSIIGRTDADFNVNPDEVALYTEADRDVMRSGQPKFINEETITNAVTGEVRYYQTAKVPLMADTLEDRRVLGVAIDITGRKQAELEREQLIVDLQEANERVLESSRLKSEFVSTMSHELRTPLNAVIGFAGIMLEGMAGKIDDSARYMVQGIYNSSQSLLSIINDILDISKIEAGRLEIISEPVNIAALVNKWQSQMSVLAQQKSIDFQVEIAPEVPEVFYGDEGRISQVAINLLSNAFKFTPNGTVRLELTWENEALMMRVIDTGIGIAPHALSFIFDEFRQVDATSQRKYGGTGLGLAIVRKLCNLMGGSVNVESALGAGSIFTVMLPLQAITPTRA